MSTKRFVSAKYRFKWLIRPWRLALLRLMLNHADSVCGEVPHHPPSVQGSSMALWLCGRKFALPRYCSLVRYQHTQTRRELIPLIKLLHPDLLGHCSDEIRQQNMSCIQNLNDMWDTLEANVESVAGKSLVNGLDIKVPFRSSYDLTCYLKGGMAAESTGQSQEVSGEYDRKEPTMTIQPFIVRIPEDLCKRQSVSQKVFTNGVDRVLLQQGLLFVHAGLENPWTKLDTTRTSGKGLNDSREDQTKEEVLGGELELHLFERWYTKARHQRDVERNSADRKGRSNLSQAFNTQHGGRGGIMEKLDAVFGDKQASVTFYEDEVDSFIKGGNLMVTGLGAQQEFLAVREMRKFLIDFGDVLHFSAAHWGKVVLLLYPSEGAARFISKRRRASRAARGRVEMTQDTSEVCVNARFTSKHHVRTGRAYTTAHSDGGASTSSSVTENGDSDGAEAEPESASVVANGGYLVEQFDEHYIVRVPHDFKTRHLLEFLGDTLPPAKMSASLF